MSVSRLTPVQCSNHASGSCDPFGVSCSIPVLLACVRSGRADSTTNDPPNDDRCIRHRGVVKVASE